MSTEARGHAAPDAHPEDDEHTEGIAYGLWLVNSPYSRDDGERLRRWAVLREETGAPTWMAKARFVQASARVLAASRAD